MLRDLNWLAGITARRTERRQPPSTVGWRRSHSERRPREDADNVRTRFGWPWTPRRSLAVAAPPLELAELGDRRRRLTSAGQHLPPAGTAGRPGKRSRTGRAASATNDHTAVDGPRRAYLFGSTRRTSACSIAKRESSRQSRPSAPRRLVRNHRRIPRQGPVSWTLHRIEPFSMGTWACDTGVLSWEATLYDKPERLDA